MCDSHAVQKMPWPLALQNYTTTKVSPKSCLVTFRSRKTSLIFISRADIRSHTSESGRLTGRTSLCVINIHELRRHHSRVRNVAPGRSESYVLWRCTLPVCVEPRDPHLPPESSAASVPSVGRSKTHRFPHHGREPEQKRPSSYRGL